MLGSGSANPLPAMNHSCSSFYELSKCHNSPPFKKRDQPAKKRYYFSANPPTSQSFSAYWLPKPPFFLTKVPSKLSRQPHQQHENQWRPLTELTFQHQQLCWNAGFVTCSSKPPRKSENTQKASGSRSPDFLFFPLSFLLSPPRRLSPASGFNIDRRLVSTRFGVGLRSLGLRSHHQANPDPLGPARKVTTKNRRTTPTHHPTGTWSNLFPRNASSAVILATTSTTA
jgi:hypothetical protein